MTNITVEIRSFTSCSPPNFSIDNLIQTVKNLGMTFKDAGYRFRELGEALRELEGKELEECREDEQEYLNIEPIFLYCKENTWDEMSYNKYNQNLLDFNYDEYSDGDWNNE